MKNPSRRRIDPPIHHEPNLENQPHLLPGLSRLAEALLVARARGEDPWHRALGLADLAPLGLALGDCRALLSAGFIETAPTSAHESGHKATPSPSGRGRGEGRGRHARNSSPRIGRRTLLLLTDLGLAKLTVALSRASASNVAGAARVPSAQQPSPLGSRQDELSMQPSPLGRGQGEGFSLAPSLSPSNFPSQFGASPAPHFGAGLATAPSPAVSPSTFGKVQDECVPRFPILTHYDIDLRELSVAGEIILRLPVQAHNLAAILTALELAAWKTRVTKPLNGRPESNDPQHLADAVYGLNRHQSLIEFRMDGGAIRWQWRRHPPQPVRFPKPNRPHRLHELR